MEVRTGKTLTALESANNPDVHSVLFITKKKAIGSVEKDYSLLKPDYEMDVINYESLHKMEKIYDLIILDEAHCVGSYPKKSKRFKDVQTIIDRNPLMQIIYLSGTPSPESYSQLFHQLRLSNEFSPFKEFVNFYKWAKFFVNVEKKNLGYATVNDYSDARKKEIMEVLNPYFISYTQKEAGFNQVVNETVLKVPMMNSTMKLISRLKKDKVIEGKNNVILADTSVKLQNKIHQLCSGTIKFEEGDSMIIDPSKANFIKKEFAGKKIAVFYIFKEEFNLLKSVFPNFTESPEEFNESEDLVFLGQIRSSREGVNLSTADALIYYNLEFSALSYIQGKDRMTSKDRTKSNDVFFIFAEGGIEEKIYDRVSNKLDFTNHYFKKNY